MESNTGTKYVKEFRSFLARLLYVFQFEERVLSENIGNLKSFDLETGDGGMTLLEECRYICRQSLLGRESCFRNCEQKKQEED